MADNKLTGESEPTKVPERIWIRPGSAEYSTVPLNYDNDDVEFARVTPPVADAGLIDRAEAVRAIRKQGLHHIDCRGNADAQGEIVVECSCFLKLIIHVIQTLPSVPTAVPTVAGELTSGDAWRKWFARMGSRADSDVVNATATLVIEERALASLPAHKPDGPTVAQAVEVANEYAVGVDDAQRIAVEALRGTRENYMATNRALEIVDAAMAALKQGREYKSASLPPATPGGEQMRAAARTIAANIAWLEDKYSQNPTEAENAIEQMISTRFESTSVPVSEGE